MTNSQDVNVLMEQFKISIINLLNNNDMPIGMTYYILKDIMNEVADEYQRYLNQASRKMQEEAAAAASVASQGDPENIAEVIED